jgi:outer membrane immunogenic protein
MTKRITSLFALTTFVLAVSGSAFAADIAIKAPPPAPAPVYNWTGWHAGVNAGASFGRAETDFNVPPFNVGGAPPFRFRRVAVGGFAGSDTEHPSGFIGGGQIGYNWQFSPIWVVGLEADFQGALEKDSNNLSNAFDTTPSIQSNLSGTTVLNYTTQIDWFGTVRGRIGYVWGTNGDVLTYVTGGLAYGEVKTNGTSTFSLAFQHVPAVSITDAIGHSQVNTGWVVGWGTEGHLPGNWIPGNWTWKIEGLYMDLGTLDAIGVEGSSPVLAAAGAGLITTHTHFTDTILRAGLNYQFH